MDGKAVDLTLRVLPRLVRMLQQATAGPGQEPLTLTQFRLLNRISHGCRQTVHLAQELDLTTATVSASIDGLVRRGLVQRLPAGGDRRVVPLDLTEQGRAALTDAHERQAAAMQAIVSRLSPDDARILAEAMNALGDLLE